MELSLPSIVNLLLSSPEPKTILFLKLLNEPAVFCKDK